MAKEFNRYTEGGRARQVKVPRFVDFKSLPEELASPDLLIWDFAKFDQPAKLHSLWQALYKYEAKVGPIFFNTGRTRFHYQILVPSISEAKERGGC